MQAKMDESEKKMELMATILQTLTKEPLREDMEIPHHEDKQDGGKGQADGKKKEE